MEPKQKESTGKNLPEKKFRAGGISVTIWQNHGQNRIGEPTVFNTISVDRRYMDKRDNEWKSTTSFRVNDLPKLALVMTKAYEYLTLKNQDGIQTI